MLKKIESLSQSKTGDKKDMEDAYIVTDDFAAVIDGATNVSGRLIAGKSPGQHAAALIKEVIEELTGPETMGEIIGLINSNFQNFYERHQMTEEVCVTPYLRPSAVMALYSDYFKKVWLIGDCQCFLNGHNYQNLKEIDTITAQARAMIVESELAHGKSVTEIMQDDGSFQLIKPIIQAQYQFQNQPPEQRFSYEVINGFDMFTESFVEIEVSEETSTLSLASDGYPKIYGSLAETESHLAAVLKRDPLCINENMSVRGLSNDRVSYDDRTYVKVSI